MLKKPAAAKGQTSSKTKPKTKPAAAKGQTSSKGKPNTKPASWIKLRPNGCAKCRNVPGCTRSCWAKRGDVPK